MVPGWSHGLSVPALLSCLGPAAKADGVEQFTGKDSTVSVAHSDFDQLETEAQGGGSLGNLNPEDVSSKPLL